MSVEIVLPDLTESMTSVKIASWLRRVGESVVAGQPVVEVETDKTTVEIEAPASGILQAICVPAGTDGVSVGTVLGVVVEGDAKSDDVPGHPEPASTRDVEPQSFQEGARIDQPLTMDMNERISATPLATRMAMLAGIDLPELSARQGGARVRKRDIDGLLSKGSAARSSWLPAASGEAIPTSETLPSNAPVSSSRSVTSSLAAPPSLAGPPSASASSGAYDVVTLTPMRRITATRLQQAKQQIPHFYLQVDCNVSELVRLRLRLNGQKPSAGLTVTDFLIVASARALQDVPVANAIWLDGEIRVYRTVDVALAVNTPKGLVTPVVRDCQSKGLDEISREVKRLADRARAGRLSPEEYTGGTFTISNLGMFGISTATPVVNPPQCCILGVGAIQNRPVAVGDGLAVGAVMSCTLAADHRAIDGATGAELLQAIRRGLEDPASLIGDPSSSRGPASPN